MNNNELWQYLVEIVSLIKEQALIAKNHVDGLKGRYEEYPEGMIMGYYSILTLMKHEAFAFRLDQQEVGLADINPERDLLGLRSKGKTSLEDYTPDAMSEDKLKGYLRDTIYILKEKALETETKVRQPQEEKTNYLRGELEAYYQALSALKEKAQIFRLDQDEIALNDIKLPNQRGEK